MKKFLLLLFSMFFFFMTIAASKVEASSVAIPDLEPHIVESRNYVYIDDQMIVLGNYQDLTNSIIDNIIDSLEEKVLIIYNVDLNNFDNDFKPSVYEYNLNIYYFDNNILIESTLETEFTSFNLIKDDCIDFFDEIMRSRFYKQDMMALQSINTDLFEIIKIGTDRKLAAPYGYIDVSYQVLKYRKNDVSSLYIVQMNSSFVCGRMALMNGDSNYGNYLQSGFYIHMSATQAEDWEEAYYHGGVPRRGGIPVYKDYWPLNAPATATISSTYSQSLTMGYSFANGFSETSGFTTENGMQFSTNVGYSYTKSYTNTEPYLSSQLSSTNPSEAQWTYIYNNDRDETGHAQTSYLFEMNNYNHSMCEGDFNLNYSFTYTVKTPCTHWYHLFTTWHYSNIEYSRIREIWIR